VTPFVRPRRVTDPALRLVVFHHAGGSAAAYHPLTRGLPASWDVLLLDLPGRGKRHALPPLEDVSAAAALAADDIMPFTGPPIALFGHSLGAVLATETARLLESRGVRPLWVGVSGRSAPGQLVPYRPLDHDLPDEQLLAGLGGVGGLHQRMAELPQFQERFLRLVRSDLRAVGSYRPDPRRTPLRAPLTAFGADQDQVAPPATMTHWARETSGAFRQRTFPGGHFYFLGPAFPRFTADLAAEIQHAATRAPGREPGLEPAPA